MKKSKFINLLMFNRWCFDHHLKTMAKFIWYKMRLKFACDIPPSVQFGEGLSFPHWALGVVIHPKTVIGSNCTIYQHVTIGSQNGTHSSTPPHIGNHVIIGANAVILGDIKIGNNVIIGAGAVVLQNIPDNCIAVGVPAKIIQKDI